MLTSSRIAAFSAAAALALPAALPAVAGPIVGQIDTFEDGTTQGWTVAGGPLGAIHPAPPANIATGGPGGADDNFLLLGASGQGAPGGRLTVLNRAQWAGVFTAAGITGLAMDLRNFGTTDLSLRLLFEAGNPLSDWAWSSTPVPLSSLSGWQRVLFRIEASDLTAPAGHSVADALAGALTLRLFHGSASAFPGDPIAAQLGVDNITAIGGDGDDGGGTVPEPGSALLVAMGLGLLLRRGRRH